ncbi:hypothetical protein A3B45_00460 [Candidatus Daviesbacteria bacterium RIFCSPLOWO2_01_FULL_39_12]|uniref:Methyltransferase type 11 domain-containing protein n=1 Tax=Candidatus Daviesbacteria bacterium RIFCSPLOWO2_01_FULL_39_12 TaxID=1797785 RepID=A0A1F5KPX6_9BACT|nr:MAG: hypothetical protein A3B45_00460 [Candidatus Daviesbacteria bacterium RIFCSPLOWO2_01_FULL_39_12]
MIKLSRDLTGKIRFIIDQFIPPILRDQKWFMLIPFKIIFQDKSDIFLNFKQKAYQLSEKEFSHIYEIVGADEWRQTDLNVGSIQKILGNIKGKTVLEVGCGKGYLAKMLAEKYLVTASDIMIDSKLTSGGSKLKFKVANIEFLPFRNKEFDTVVTTHTLEHIRNINKAISELRRVARKRLIIVVPKQRPYLYTFDLHLHFFPYLHSLLTTMTSGSKIKSICQEIEHDLYYQEDRE